MIGVPLVAPRLSTHDILPINVPQADDIQSSTTRDQAYTLLIASVYLVVSGPRMERLRLQQDDVHGAAQLEVHLSPGDDLQRPVHPHLGRHKIKLIPY